MNSNTANQILQDQRLTIKKGRTNGLGFEPCFNSFYDFYLDSKYGPLLQLEDVTFFLYLRKNLNDKIDWRMPSVRYTMKKFSIGYGRYKNIISRLEKAYLLKKLSGVRNESANERNDYILNDPLTNLDDFTLVFNLQEGVTEIETHVAKIETPSVAETETGGVAETETLNRLNNKQTIWNNVMSSLQSTMSSETFNFLEDSELINVEGTAIIETPKESAIEWIQAQLSSKLIKLLNIELMIAGEEKITQLEVRKIC